MPDDTDQKSGGGSHALPPPVDSGLRGSCPRCGARTLFKGFTAFADKCPSCGLDFTRFNVGDGPVVFMTLGLGALIVMLALWVEFRFSPPFWVHPLLWVPLTLGLVLLCLRFGKGLLLALEFRNRAEEGRLKDSQ